MSQKPGDCVLCGSETAETRMQLVEWCEPVGTQRWSVIPRCTDRTACRARVEDVLGEAWPIADGTPARDHPDPMPVEPVPAANAEGSFA